MRKSIALLAALLATLHCLSAPPQPLVVVTLYEGGLARVDYYVPTGGNLSIAIPLVSRPDESLGVVVVDEWGEPLAYGINESLGTLFATCINCSLVRVSYYTQELTVKVGAAWSVNLTTPYPARLVLPPNATVTYVLRLPKSVYSWGDRLVLEFDAGELSVKYVLLYSPPPTEPQQPPSSRQAQPQQPPSQAPPEAEPWLVLLRPPYAYFLALPLVAVVAGVLLTRRRKRPEALVELSEEDVAILEALRKLGGGAFQSELQKTLNLPSTTLWRRVKRLEGLGYLIVEKRAGRNYIRLA